MAEQMSDINIKIPGRFTTWDLVESFNHQTLKDAFDGIGAGNLAPNQRSMIAALRLVLDKAYAGAGRKLVVPARAPQGTFIVTQVDGEGIDAEKSKTEGDRDIAKVDVKPKVVCKAWVAKDANGMEVVEAEFTPPEGQVAPLTLDVLRAGVRKAQSYVDSRDLVLKLGGLLDRWRAIPLRAGGGAYFLPETHIADWNVIRTAIGNASIGPKKAAVHTAPFIADSEFGEMVVSSLGNDLKVKISQLEADNEDLGERRLQTKAAMARDLLKTIEQYEGLVSRKLDHLREMVSATEDKLVDLAALAHAENERAKNERARVRAEAKASDKVTASTPVATQEETELSDAQLAALAALGL